MTYTLEFTRRGVRSMAEELLNIHGMSMVEFLQRGLTGELYNPVLRELWRIWGADLIELADNI